MLPVAILTCFFLVAHYNQQYKYATDRRLLALIITVIMLYAWIIIGVLRRKQDTSFEILVQSSFYVYLFSVLTLTGYFILFKEVSAHDWWGRMLTRVAKRKGVNLTLFNSIRHYGLLNYQVLGNLIMLLPLGIYVPLLYKKIRSFLGVVFVCMMVSVSIELMQLITNVRVSDVDDVFLNTLGASLGYILYRLVAAIFSKPPLMPMPSGAS